VKSLSPVANGNTPLIKFESDGTTLIDINIRVLSDDARDVAADLRKSLKEEEKGVPIYVDVMVLSSSDTDHRQGFQEHFYTEPLDAYSDNADRKKIVFREIWSSPLVFRSMQRKSHKRL